MKVVKSNLKEVTSEAKEMKSEVKEMDSEVKEIADEIRYLARLQAALELHDKAMYGGEVLSGLREGEIEVCGGR